MEDREGHGKEYAWSFMADAEGHVKLLAGGKGCKLVVGLSEGFVGRDWIWAFVTGPFSQLRGRRVGLWGPLFQVNFWGISGLTGVSPGGPVDLVGEEPNLGAVHYDCGRELESCQPLLSLCAGRVINTDLDLHSGPVHGGLDESWVMPRLVSSKSTDPAKSPTPRRVSFRLVNAIKSPIINQAMARKARLREGGNGSFPESILKKTIHKGRRCGVILGGDEAANLITFVNK